MADEVTAIRPPVISPATRRCLDEYRGFRHLVRNVYTFNLRTSRLRELTEELRPCFKAVQDSLTDFTQFLDQLAIG